MKQKMMLKDAVVLAVLPYATADAMENCDELNTEHKLFRAYRQQ